jgi:hypothetical protein
LCLHREGILHKIDELLDGEVFADGPAMLRTKIADAHQPVALSLAGAKTEGVVDRAAEFHALGKISFACPLPRLLEGEWPHRHRSV